ncbi:helix-turn-helix domain-containing protein [Gilliamella sp. Nev5-1]|uniref:helix-turn-helix domain-containing protein n=1 Tax=Gilliamella sp. Nev5-1 TaxID=3120251 RepID=UPI001C547713|nr:helix-turn-helix domain-containing protein [Gilliamella apicola]
MSFSILAKNRKCRAPETIDRAIFDEQNNLFLMKNNDGITAKDFFISHCVLGLICFAVQEDVHMIGGQTLASAVGKINLKYETGLIRYERWLKSNDFYEFYENTIKLIRYIKINGEKFNALTIADDIILKQTQFDGDDPFGSPLDRFAVREEIYHQTYSLGENSVSAEKVLNARKAAGLTQKQSANLVYVDERTWARWEAGDRKMNKNIYELFLIKTGLFYN